MSITSVTLDRLFSTATEERIRAFISSYSHYLVQLSPKHHTSSYCYTQSHYNYTNTHILTQQPPQSLLKSITILPATSPLLSCCTLSAISLMPLTSQIDLSKPLLA